MFLKSLIKYLIEGFAISLVLFLVPSNKLSIKEIAMIGLTASSIFAVLDITSPTIGQMSKNGFGLGTGLILGNYGVESFDNLDGNEVEPFNANSANDGLICKDINNVCKFTPESMDIHKQNFICSRVGGNCSVVEPCYIDNGSCKLHDIYSKDIGARQCSFKGNRCTLLPTQSPPSSIPESTGQMGTTLPASPTPPQSKLTPIQDGQTIENFSDYLI